MRYHNIVHDDMLNGDGIRVTLFVAGCDHHCKGCQNPITWDPDGGIEFTVAEMNEIDEQLRKPYISGISLSGGDPMYLSNREAIECLCKWVKTAFPGKTIWCYTGYLFDEIKHLPVMEYIDVLVDGKFVERLKDNTLHWRGSSNQNIWRKIDGVWKLSNE